MAKQSETEVKTLWRTMSRRKRHNSPFAKNLSSLMKEKGMGVREAARIAGVSHGTISNWCAGVAPDDFMAVKKLAEKLGVTFSWMMTGENDASPGRQPTVSEVFDDGEMLFDGHAKITIQRLVPKNRPGRG